MTRARKILSIVFGLVAVALVTAGFVISHNSSCEPAPALAADVRRMQAIVYRCYGSPAVLRLEEVAVPPVADGQVLVKVRAASVNPLDWHYMRGSPYLMRASTGIGAPTDPAVGVDFAGTVEAVGKDVKRLRPGDEVFGAGSGAFAEYVAVPERLAVLKPANVTFEQAAAVPVAAITALQALRDQGKLRSGQKVLINGASGGVGTFAVQIAKMMGAEVTGVCSTRNVQLVRSLGADHVVDYTREDFTRSERRYDLIMDNVANRGLRDLLRVLEPSGTLVIIGGAKGDWIGPFGPIIKAQLLSPFIEQDVGMMIAELKQQDLTLLAELMQAGKITPVIDRTFPLSETAAAMAYVEEGHARAKVVLSVGRQE